MLLRVQTLSFTVAAVPADASKVKLPGGAVSQKIAEAAAGAGSLVTAISPGAQFTNAVFFIDSNQQAVSKVAQTKWGWGGAFPPSQPPFTEFCFTCTPPCL